MEKKYADETKSIWAKNVNGKRPSYKPLCGYTGSECPQNLTIYIAIGSGLILLLFLAATCGVGYAIRWAGIFGINNFILIDLVRKWGNKNGWPGNAWFPIWSWRIWIRCEVRSNWRNWNREKVYDPCKAVIQVENRFFGIK